MTADCPDDWEPYQCDYVPPVVPLGHTVVRVAFSCARWAECLQSIPKMGNTPANLRLRSAIVDMSEAAVIEDESVWIPFAARASLRRAVEGVTVYRARADIPRAVFEACSQAVRVRDEDLQEILDLVSGVDRNEAIEDRADDTGEIDAAPRADASELLPGRLGGGAVVGAPGGGLGAVGAVGILRQDVSENEAIVIEEAREAGGDTACCVARVEEGATIPDCAGTMGAIDTSQAAEAEEIVNAAKCGDCAGVASVVGADPAAEPDTADPETAAGAVGAISNIASYGLSDAMEGLGDGAAHIIESPPEPVVPVIPFATIDAMKTASIRKYLDLFMHDYPDYEMPPGLGEMPLAQLRETMKAAVTSPVIAAKRAREAAELAEAHKYDRFFHRSEKGVVVLKFAAIADHVATETHAISYRDMIYVYDVGQGIHRLNDNDIEERVQEIAEGCGYAGKITTAKREVVSYISGRDVRREYPFNHYHGVPVQNGVVVIDYKTGKKTLEAHKAENLYTYRLPVTYDPTAETDSIDAVIAAWVDEENRGTLYQIPAQAILQATVSSKPYKKSYIIQGDAHAAKSSYLELLNRCFGDENTSRVMLQQIGKDRFCLSLMEGKLFNIYDDLDDVPLDNASVLKTLTGFDLHNVERKGIDAYRARIFAVHVYTCNTPPTTDGKVQNDAAFWERWEYIAFPNYFAVDPEWYDRVLTPKNCSAFFNRVLDYAVQIRQTGGLVVRSNAYDVRDVWQTNSDPIYKFIQENMDSSETGHVMKHEMYDAFVAFARTEGVQESKVPLNVDMFAKAVFKYGFTDARVMVEKKRVRVFRGYAWKAVSQYKPKTTMNAAIAEGA